MLKWRKPSIDSESSISWIASTVLDNFLGISFTEADTEENNFVIFHDNRSLTVCNAFFRNAPFDWLSRSSLPALPLAQWDVRTSGIKPNLIRETIPVLFGQPGFSVDALGNGYLGLDIFGSAFFMLTRYEEIVLDERDNHSRFPVTASIAHKAGFLDRPIVDEYIEILWICMKRLWPNLVRKRRQARTVISCDVDVPYEPYVKGWQTTVRKMGGDLLKHHSPCEAARTLRNFWCTRAGNYSKDPQNTFEWIMDVNEKAGNRVAFYFLVDHTVPTFDAQYDIQEVRICALMRRIHERGHEIGLHGSYGSYRNSAQLKKEVDLLRQVLEREGIHQPNIGGRQHYLRWSSRETASFLDAAGLAYDSTLSYADHAGFRCGTCHEYQMYDVIKRRSLHLRQRPLVVMEASVMDQVYMGLGIGHDAEVYMQKLRDACRQFGGNFTMLWHNSSLQKPASRQLYRAMIC